MICAFCKAQVYDNKTGSKVRRPWLAYGLKTGNHKFCSDRHCARRCCRKHSPVVHRNIGQFLYALEKMCNEIKGLEDERVWRSTANTLYGRGIIKAANVLQTEKRVLVGDEL